MKICSECAAENGDADRFCHECGGYIDDNESVTVADAREPEASAGGQASDALVLVGSEELDDARAEIEAAEQAAAEARRQAEQAARAREDAEARARAEADRRAREEQAQAEEEARRLREAEERRRAEEAQRRAEEEAGRRERERRERAARERQEAEEAARRAADERARREAEEQAAREAEETARREAEAEAQRLNERARIEAIEDESRRREAEEAARKAAEERARREAEERAAREAEERSRREAEEQAAREAEEQARREAEAQAAREAEEQARREAEAQAAREAEERATREAEAAREAEEAAREVEERRRRTEELFRAEEAARKDAEEAARREAEVRRLEEEARRKEQEAQERLRRLVDKGATTTGRARDATADEVVESAGGPTRVIIQEPPTRRARPGDKICTRCGEVNEGAHNFCRRCGHDLRETEEVATPWWKRLVGAVSSRRRRPVAAGERPGRGGTGRGGVGGVKDRYQRGRRLLAYARRGVALVALAAAAAGIAGPPAVRDPIRDVADSAWQPIKRLVNPDYTPVRPTGASASSELAGSPAPQAIDGYKNRPWAEGAPGDGVGEVITITFEEATDIDRIGITPGVSDDPGEFISSPRPRELHIVFRGVEEVTSADVVLDDEATFQDFDVDGNQVTSVEIEVVSVFGSTGDAMAIAELEFYVKE